MMSDYPEWKVAERQCMKIVGGYYHRAYRAGTESGGDVLRGDVLASSGSSKVLIAQVKDYQQKSDAAVRSYQDSASSVLDGSHVDFEVWQRGSEDWKVYPIPLNQRAMVEVEYVSLPLDVDEAIDEYTKFRSGKAEMESHE